MKFLKSTQHTRKGSALAITLVTTGVIGAALVTYLTLAKNQSQMTGRSQTWNACIPIAEAGIEEALAHLNFNGTNKLGSQSWTLSGGVYSKSNAVGKGYYLVSIAQSAPYDITSTGYYPLPATSSHLSRTVKVETKRLGVFVGSLVAKQSIKFNGNNTLVDSYDSTDPSKSTGGLYDATKAGDDADMGFMGALANLDIGNGNVWGKLFTDPTGSLSTGPNGAVGSASWNQSGSSGAEAGWLETDFNYTFADVEKPFAAGVPPLSGTVSGVYYDYILSSGEFEVPSLGGKVLVTGQAILYVNGNIKLTGQDRIEIISGGSLQLYGAGAKTEINEINNANQNSAAFQYYGLPANTTVDMNGTLLYGAIYAPQATVQLSGNSVIYASVVANNIILNGNASVHYDEALQEVGLSQGYTVISWDEL